MKQVEFINAFGIVEINFGLLEFDQHSECELVNLTEKYMVNEDG